ncbi:class I SAM-dependent methyltransferase [Clostridium tagluense]|uniref:class I SAM-dependent methyltransferase n=1 Tax=Clostridium tagluense TaxID=360422 RepID=UPI001C0E4B80|nr:class I SAM-dependent methyltransferase [Clostridium tagluense]MBU3130131.1 class I SAM-dependent methyltransferase [Clostridium tagluense]
MKSILEYYENYDEEARLVKDNAHKIEFITTMHYLDKIVKPGARILEVGAGTGRYSFCLAEKGHSVTALDITPKHIEIMKEKANHKDLDINIVLGDAKNLSGFKDNSYDVVLCLGPLYHFSVEEEKIQCLDECLRVLKSGGILAVAYINRFSTFVNMINRKKENINDEGLNNIVKTGLEYGDERDCFYYSKYDDIENLMDSFNITKISHIGTDGLVGLFSDKLNEFNGAEFEKWMEYHLMTCSDSSLIGYSQHGLYICEKI